MAAHLVVEIDGPPSLSPPAEPAAASRICTASRRLHRHYRMRRKRRAARRRPPSGGPQFNVKTLGRLRLRSGNFGRPNETNAVHPSLLLMERSGGRRFGGGPMTIERVSLVECAKNLARNPLGIIALFIVLVYGFASLMVGFSDKLQ